MNLQIMITSEIFIKMRSLNSIIDAYFDQLAHECLKPESLATSKPFLGFFTFLTFPFKFQAILITPRTARFWTLFKDASVM